MLEAPREVVLDCVGLVRLSDNRIVLAQYPERACREKFPLSEVGGVDIKETRGSIDTYYRVIAFRAAAPHQVGGPMTKEK